MAWPYRTRLIGFSILLWLLTVLPTGAQNRNYGILNQPAPTLGVKQWMQLPADKEILDVSDFKGKVVYLYCFQNWCPGCHSHGFPTLQKLQAHYKDDPNVVVLAVQTTFEGFWTNTFENIPNIVEEYGLHDIPIGQSGSEAERSMLMRNYRTGGTPWTIIIDRQGIVRYNDFHINPQAAIEGMDYLKENS